MHVINSNMFFDYLDLKKQYAVNFNIKIPMFIRLAFMKIKAIWNAKYIKAQNNI